MLLLVLLAAPAYADDPRDLFGLGKQKQTEKVRCDDAKTLGCAFPTDRFDEVSPYAVRTWLPASYLLKLPVADARADAVAHYAVGASRDEAGPVFGGATGLENRWTIEGAPADNLRTGNFETRVPLTFVEGILVTAGGFAARDRNSTGGNIDVQLRRGTAKHAVEAHAWASMTGDPTRRPLATSAYTLRRVFVEAGPDTSASVVATGPLPGFSRGKAWYAAGIAPAIAFTDFSWEAARLVDADGDRVPDGFPGVIALEGIESTSERTLDYLVPMMARAGWERGVHAVDLTLIGHAQRDSAFLGNATQQAAGVDREGWVGDAIARWSGRWKRTRARAQFAWHRSVRRESAHDPAAENIPQLLSAYVPTTLAEDPVLAEACRDGTETEPDGDPYPLIPNCPIPFGFFASAGAGLLTNTTGDRPTLTADVAHARGNHVVRAGATVEDTRLVLDSRFTGGEQIRSLFDGHTDRQRFYEGLCPSHTIEQPVPFCNYTTSQELRYRTRYTAVYVEDTFELAPNIRVNGGLRWELMWVGTQLHLSKQWAPRLGIAWDFLRGNTKCPDCTARAWASMGRSFVMLPAGLGPTVIRRNNTVRDVEFGLGPSRSINPGNVFSVADGIRPAAQDEVTAGIELGVPKLARFTVWGQGRTLRRGYETILVDLDTAVFDNPGRHGEAPADRNTLVLALEAMFAPSPKLTVRASYLYGRTVGSWTGPFDPRQGTQLYNGADWDSDTGNIYGRLPTDAGHRVLFEIERRGKVGNVEIATAARLTTASGRPRNALGDGDLGIIYLLPRGSAGRGELISQANARVGARWQRTDIRLDVFNLFDHRTSTNPDEIYADGSLQPIVGGSEEDLVWLKSGMDTARRRTAYRLPLAYQPPIAVTLGVSHAF